MKIIAILSLFAASFASAAAPAGKPAARPAAQPAARAAAQPGGPGFCIFGAQSGKPFGSEAAFKSVVWKSDVVYVGETHDQPLDHLAQLEALKAMRIARGSKIAVGFEMLNQSLQPVLDDYAAGRMTEAEFLEKADWKKEWGFDFAMYKPLFDFIVANKLRALALNVPRPVVAKIARAGLESLSPEEKKYLPETVTVSAHKKYNEFLKESFSGHGDSPMAKMFTLENYLASMAAWNEGMGLRIADFLGANPGYAALVVAGNGHVAYNAAIPASVKARVKGVRQASFYTETAAQCPEKFPKEHKDLANYVWYIAHPPKPAAPVASSTGTPVGNSAAEPVMNSTAAPAALPVQAPEKK
ncbi:MAG TPA: ChaN family lipoprotein [Elusimicrobiales bacterium]|nr:ChaN family lipoprotein [Elusimicrobiales bacterium]